MVDAGVELGFSQEFLDFTVETPTPDAAIADDIIEVDGSPQLDYVHFSLAMSESRRIARWVAWNIDGSTMKKGIGRDDAPFKPDPRLAPGQQMLDDVYAKNNLDRGHLARRADLLWGTRSEAAQANEDSFFFTNITPQLDTFNQSSKVKGIWGKLENALTKEAGRQRVSVIGGPVLSDTDKLYRNVLVPREFWKVLVYDKDGDSRARAFVVSQNLSQIRDLEDDHLKDFEVYKTSLIEVEKRTQLRLDAGLHVIDAYEADVAGALEARPPLDNLAEVSW